MRLQLNVALAVLALADAAGMAEPASPPPAPDPTPAPRRVTGHLRGELAAYADSDHVEVLTPSLAADAQNPVAGWAVRGEYLVDAVSAASVDIVSTASPHWTEVRQAGAVAGSFKPHNFGVNGTASLSLEPDYRAWAAGGSVEVDLDQKNFTLLLGYGRGHDLIGRAGTPFSVFSRSLTRDAFDGALTIVVNRATVVVAGGDLVIERGDQSKPYRYVPLFAPDVAPTVPRAASTTLVNQLRLPERPLEQLPLARDRYAAWARYLQRFSRLTLRLEERLYTDSWSLRASSTDARLLGEQGERWLLGAHVRLHAQTGVSFWQRAYTLTEAGVPALRTGDRELGPLWSLTGGASARWKGGKPNPTGWTIGADVDLTWTSFLDDLYMGGRLAGIVTFVWETDL